MQLNISTANSVYALGKPIRVDVTIANTGDRTLVLDEPASSLAVEMHLVDRRTREDLSYTMGRVDTTVFPGAGDRYALVVPMGKPFQIGPHASFSFSTDPQQRLFLRPGVFDSFLTIDADQSNRIQLTVEFNRGSVDELFALARDPAQAYARREWAMDWLAKLYPAFRLALPTPDAADPSRAQLESSNRTVYESFATWWRANQQGTQMDERLQRLR